MVCRNKDKAEEARADIIKETGNKVQSDSPFETVSFLKTTTVTRLAILNLFIAGNLCPHPGPVRDQEGLGVRRGLQEKVQGPQRAGGLFFMLQVFISSNFTAAPLLFKSYSLPLLSYYWIYFG